MTDQEIDVQALLDNIDRIRATIVKAAPGLRDNHHNFVRVSVIEELVGQALGYAKKMN